MGNNRSIHLNETSISRELKKPEIDFLPLLKKHGWELLGIGAEAIVAHHPQKRYVLKLFPANSKFKHFVSFCLRRPTLANFPRFGALSRKIPGTNWMYVRMELLQPVSEQQLLSQYLPHLCYIKHKADELDIHWMNHLETHVIDAVRTSIETNPSLVAKMSQKLGLTKPKITSKQMIAREIARKGATSPPAWRKACDDLLQFMDMSNYSILDLHALNFMLRDNQLIILDPWI